MHQLQLIDQDSRLLDDLVNTVISPTLSRSAKLAEIGRILAHFDLPIEAPSISGQLWSATALGKELGVSAQAIGRLANQHNLKVPELGEYRLDQAVHSRKQVQTFYYNKLGRHRLESLLIARTTCKEITSIRAQDG
ncbi:MULTISPECIES: hypothetical protein [Aeromonas]|uniref:hypothetical protein n=1 Tax=Aeromonas TaxID=642 RepID=UPI000F546EE3|nr:MULTISPECIES: hypothetical protein [Aeromonas]KAE9635964.1 hypothetical protein GO977_08775 [Aeromonas veronii]MCQ4053110.1 hypothetical protein [Aeromonas sp. SG16]RQM78046.1 hypothetical protein EHZ47_02540 [Aeromonas jandaei]WAG08230.1 hypothetical protein NRZ30_03960 [Aeromonas jandaei]WFO49777.1 hypothetical protein L1O00_12090 [Aeromonas veronii]